MKTLKLFTILFFALSLFSFSFKGLQKKDVKEIKLTEADAEWASKKWNGTTLEDLKSGQEIFYTNCDKCHKLKDPKNFTEEKLIKIVPKMAKKGKINLDDKQENLVLKFLITAGRTDEKK